MDVVVAALIFCVATWVGVFAVQGFKAAGGVQDFYQQRFGPAVMAACGRAFQEPDTRLVPRLSAFLNSESGTFDCAQLPATLATAPLDVFQSASRYLLLTAAATWRLFGVSWSALEFVAGVLFGSVAALTYGVLRIGLSRTFALLAFVPAITSTPNIMLAPQLRDYAKGPFLLAVILIMGWLVRGPADRGRVIRLAIVAGTVIGLGLGFRTDLIIAVAPVVVTLACLVPATVPVRVRAAAIGVFLATFLVAGFPILRVYAKGGNTGHVMLLGLGAPFDGPLRVEPAIYEFAGQYNDSLAYSIINSYALRVERRRVLLGSAEYEDAGRHYLAHLAQVFPADAMTRVVAAVRAVPHYFLDTSLYPPVQARSRVIRWLYQRRASILWRLAPFSAAAVGAALVGMSIVNPRAACLAMLVLLGFAGSSALQFHERHFFYLQFVPWLAFGLVGEGALALWRGVPRPPTPRIARALLFDAAIVGGVVAALFAARAYQQRAVTALFGGYEMAPRTGLSTVPIDAGNGRTLLAARRWLDPLPSGARWVEAQLVAVQFRDDLCGPGVLPVTIRYSGNPPDVDLSESITIRLGAAAPAPTTLYVAAFDRADESIRFRGVEVTAERSRCVGGLSIVEGLDTAPLLLTTQLGPAWRDERLHERLR
jgi:hypothetical protein